MTIKKLKIENLYVYEIVSLAIQFIACVPIAWLMSYAFYTNDIQLAMLSIPAMFCSVYMMHHVIDRFIHGPFDILIAKAKCNQLVSDIVKQSANYHVL